MILATLETLTLDSPLLWLPLFAALLFSLGGLFLKRSSAFKVGVWRTTFVSNLSTCAAIIPTFMLGGNIPDWHYFWQPVVLGILFVISQMTTVIALTKGEVSVAGPVLGLKIVLVAFFGTLLFDKPLPMNIWISSFLATLGVIMLNITESKEPKKSVFLSIFCAFIAAVGYGLLDVLLQRWSEHWGIGRILPLTFICGAFLTMLIFIPLFEGKLKEVSREAWFWMLSGSLIIGFNSLIIVTSISYFKRAPTINVLYSTRGLFGILLVVMIGKYIGVRDQTLYGKTFWYRLAGAVLICISIYQLMG